VRRGRGIYPIASRRHQGGNRGGGYRVEHDPTGDGPALAVIWILVPLGALLGPITGKFDYLSSLVLMIVVGLFASWTLLTS
jgi:hypothetical protein